MRHGKVVISGASGMIGSALAARLRAEGYEVAELVREQPGAEHEYRWDPYEAGIDPEALEGARAVVNLSGAGIGDKRWTPERRRVLYESRITTTRVLAEHMAAREKKPEVFISQSAIGIYGDRADEVLDESSQLGPPHDFLANLVKDWEAAAQPASEAGIRVVHPRTGLVLEGGEGLLGRLIPIFKLGVGGPLGNGRQWWSWITLDDLIMAFQHLIESDLEGPVNVVAPQPVRQREFADALGDVLRRPALVPVPRFAMRLALGSEMADSLGFTSARVEPVRLGSDGFEWSGTELRPALRSVLDRHAART